MPKVRAGEFLLQHRERKSRQSPQVSPSMKNLGVQEVKAGRNHSTGSYFETNCTEEIPEICRGSPSRIEVSTDPCV